MQDVTHIKKFLGIALADKALRELTGIEWRDALTKDDGTIQKLSRKMAYMFEYPVDYKYAGLTLPGIPWEKSAVEIKSVLEDHLFAEFEGPAHKFKFNSVLLNLYEDGRDSIRWHSDKERQLGKNPVIACINLGATRKFSFMRKREPIEAWQCWNEIRSIPQEVRERFISDLSDDDVHMLQDLGGNHFTFARKRKDLIDPSEEWHGALTKELYGMYTKAKIISLPQTERVDYTVEHGDLLLMGPDCQENWLHSIPEDKSVSEPRISLTYRAVPALNNSERCVIFGSYPLSPIIINERGCAPVSHYVEGVDFNQEKIIAERTTYEPMSERYNLVLHLKHISMLDNIDAEIISRLCDGKDGKAIATAVANGDVVDVDSQKILEVHRFLKATNYAVPHGKWSVEDLVFHKIIKLRK